MQWMLGDGKGIWGWGSARLLTACGMPSSSVFGYFFCRQSSANTAIPRNTTTYHDQALFDSDTQPADVSTLPSNRASLIPH